MCGILVYYSFLHRFGSAGGGKVGDGEGGGGGGGGSEGDYNYLIDAILSNFLTRTFLPSLASLGNVRHLVKCWCRIRML